MGALTVADFLDDEGVEADLVDALLQAIRHIDLLYFAMQALHLGVAQLRTQDLIIELLYAHIHIYKHEGQPRTVTGEKNDTSRAL